MSPESQPPENFTTPPPVEAMHSPPQETGAETAGNVALVDNEAQLPGLTEQSAVGEWRQSPDGKGWVREAATTTEAVDPEPQKPGRQWVPDKNGGWRRETLSTQELKTEGVETETSQYDKNIELLKGSEMGVLLVEAYKSAVSFDPRLAETVIVPYDKESKKGARGSAFARVVDQPEGPRYEIHVRTGEIDESLDLMADTLDSVPGLREMMAEMLMIEPSELTPAQVHTFVMLHEMGHIVEFMDHADDIEGLRERQRREKAALPLGKISTSQVIDPDSAGGKYVRENWEQISKHFGVSTIEELAKITNAAHRSMTSERVADNFAADVLSLEPTLLDQLGSADLEQYRNWYQDQAA